MLESDVFVKTEAGRDEIRSRSRGLPGAIRAILLMVDGQRPVSAMRALIAGSKAPSNVLDTLVTQGLIESRSGPSPTPTPTPGSTTPVERSPPVRAIAFDGPIDIVLPTIGDDGGAAGPVPTVQPPVPVPVEVPTARPVESTGTPSGAAPPTGPVPLDRYEHLYTMMNEIVRDFLAPHRRYFIQLKIERCTTPDELLETLHDLQTALAKARGDAFASEVITRIRAAAH